MFCNTWDVIRNFVGKETINMDIDDLISFENENTTLDFKAKQYVKQQYGSLIKDVMAMANSSVIGDKYIIVGVKHKSCGDREFLSIKKTEFIDSATYQQIILENIEPSISLDYFSYQYEGNTLGIFKISDCFDRPYMMKKDYGNLKKGDCFIRKGSQQSRMERRDFDQIIESIKSEINFEEVTHLYFSGFPELEVIELAPVQNFKLPSEKAKEKIIEALKQKGEETEVAGPLSLLSSLGSLVYSMGNMPYSQRTIEELEKNLENVQKTYCDHDYYEMFELNAHKLNITILNKGNSYLEDSTLEIVVKKMPGLVINSEIYSKPVENHTYTSYVNFSRIESISYPEVQSTNDFWIIKQHIGDIKHQIPTEGFGEDLRVILGKSIIGQTISFQCKLFAKNLDCPLERDLKIKIVEPKECC